MRGEKENMKDKMQQAVIRVKKSDYAASTESIYSTDPSSNTAYGGKLFIDYAKAEEIGIRLKSLMHNECA